MTVFWSPEKSAFHHSQMAQFMTYVNHRLGVHFKDYPALYNWSVEDPGEFWHAFWDWSDIKCKAQPSIVYISGEKIQDSIWMGGALFNFAENLLRRKDNQLAITFTGENGDRATLTYAELWHQVAIMAQYLRDEGIAADDRVCAVVPNFHLTVVCMLAVTSLGAVWCSCSPDFGLDALVARFHQVSPLVLIAVDGHYYNGKCHEHLEKIMQLQKKLSSIQSTIILPFVGADCSEIENSVHYDLIMQNYSYVNEIKFEYFLFSHPVYILFSSGTTGKPKCIVHGAGGTLLQHLKEHRLHGDMKPGEKLLFYTTCGWMMWNWSVSVLAAEGTLVLYDGSPFFPKKTRLFDLIDEEKVDVLGVGSKYLEVCEAEGLAPKETNSLQSLRMILATASPLLPSSFDYVAEKIKSGIQLSSISGGSDIISCFFLGNPLLPVYRGELQAAGLGMHMKIYGENADELIGERGELVCVTPFPSMPIYFWGDPEGERYQSAYFDRFFNVWAHGDFALIRENMSTIIFGRSDTTLNPGGIRIGTAEIYQAVSWVDGVSEALAVGQTWQGDERIVLFVVLKTGVELNDALITHIKQTIRKKLSPKHVPAIVLSVAELPKTVNGKLVEMAVKEIVNGRDPGNITALENPICLEAFKNRKELT
jgi:acetoacetyl-CoA synthetase